MTTDELRKKLTEEVAALRTREVKLWELAMSPDPMADTSTYGGFALQTTNQRVQIYGMLLQLAIAKGGE